jgi:mercuric ion binding protein
MRRRHILLSALIFFSLATGLMSHAQAAREAEARSVTLAVQNMTCASCPITVRKALEKVPGVVKAKVDYATKTATVTFDPGKTHVEALTRATTEAGYPSTLASGQR